MKYLITLCTAVMLVGSVSAQKIQVLDGSIDPLADQTTIAVEFTYDNMVIGDDKTESEYIAEKTKNYNEKENGKGDKWAKDWVSDRKTRYEPQFLELFTKHSTMEPNKPNAKYTLIFKTTRTEPGFNIGVMRRNAYIDGEFWIVETANKNNVIAKVSIKNSPGMGGMGYDFDTGLRIQESYAKAGKEFGAYIAKMKKKKKK